MTKNESVPSYILLRKTSQHFHSQLSLWSEGLESSGDGLRFSARVFKEETLLSHTMPWRRPVQPSRNVSTSSCCSIWWLVRTFIYHWVQLRMSLYSAENVTIFLTILWLLSWSVFWSLREGACLSWTSALWPKLAALHVLVDILWSCRCTKVTWL